MNDDIATNEYGEVVEEEEDEPIERVHYPPFLRDMDRTASEFDARMNECVRSFRLAKPPNKLSDFERAALDGTVWTRRRRT